MNTQDRIIARRIIELLSKSIGHYGLTQTVPSKSGNNFFAVAEFRTFIRRDGFDGFDDCIKIFRYDSVANVQRIYSTFKSSSFIEFGDPKLSQHNAMIGPTFEMDTVCQHISFEDACTDGFEFQLETMYEQEDVDLLLLQAYIADFLHLNLISISPDLLKYSTAKWLDLLDDVEAFYAQLP